MFVDRFTFSKSYDLGETGRFGDQLNFLPILLVSPNGIGPFVYGKIFGAIRIMSF